MSNRKRAPFAVHRLLDAEPAVALVRYDGDPDVFTALAADWLRDEGIRRPIAPPKPRLYRCNPDFTGKYGWLLGTPDRPGPGTFLGALIELMKWPEGVCIDEVTGERHPEHTWSEWRERSTRNPPTRPTDVVRSRNCQHCCAGQAVTHGERELAFANQGGSGTNE
jgi:hypothetical protein